MHPNNPTGSFVKPLEAEELNRICASPTWRSSPMKCSSIIRCRKNRRLHFRRTTRVLTFTLSGLSKISGLPQMKVAWIAANGPQPLLSDAMNRLEVIADTYLSMNAPLQWAVPVMLEERRQHTAPVDATDIGESCPARLTTRLARSSVAGWKSRADGMPYCGSRWRAPTRTWPSHCCARPGCWCSLGHFYDFAADGHLVISLITPAKEFAEGIRRLLRFVGSPSFVRSLRLALGITPGFP